MVAESTIDVNGGTVPAAQAVFQAFPGASYTTGMPSYSPPYLNVSPKISFIAGSVSSGLPRSRARS